MPDRTHLTDQILVLRCQLGDEVAFERLLAEYDSRIRYYVRRILGSNDKADDVMQVIWLTVWRRLPKLRNVEAFRLWLYRIARNIAVQDLRTSKKEQQALRDGLQVPDEQEEPFSPEEAAAVHAALNTISPAHKEVLALRFIEGMSYEEIAQLTECSLGTVRSRIHYGKKALRSEMETENGK